MKSFKSGLKYKLLEDYEDIINGIVPKGSILVFRMPNLGYAKFYFNGIDIAINPKKAFKILEEVKKTSGNQNYTKDELYDNPEGSDKGVKR